MALNSRLSLSLVGSSGKRPIGSLLNTRKLETQNVLNELNFNNSEPWLYWAFGLFLVFLVSVGLRPFPSFFLFPLRVSYILVFLSWAHLSVSIYQLINLFMESIHTNYTRQDNTYSKGDKLCSRPFPLVPTSRLSLAPWKVAPEPSLTASNLPGKDSEEFSASPSPGRFRKLNLETVKNVIKALFPSRTQALV